MNEKIQTANDNIRTACEGSNVKPLLSIIVLCYKIARFLPQCLESIRNQTFTDFEVIMVDDGSPDESGRICDEYAARDSRFKVIHRENGGIVAARKTGINAASGIWCGAVDGDDWIESDMYEKMVGAALEHGVDFVQCGETLRYRTKDEPDCHRPEMLYDREALIKGFQEQAKGEPSILEVSLCRTILKTNRLQSIINDLDDSCCLCEDAACILIYASEAESMYDTGKPLYNYRLRKGSCTTSIETRSVDGLHKLYLFAEEKLKNHAEGELLLTYMAVYFVRHCMATILMETQNMEESRRGGHIESRITDPKFQKIISLIPLRDYNLVFKKSTVECIIFHKVPGIWIRNNVFDDNILNSAKLYE